ncbi:hypothetical protein [Microbacterium saperdae]|uniref:hypothetical protein n=1 Tax=Microbacterium saperdae TaxID=69368 RepID=UPI001154470A|nr:hypothetical protein [Microbacterium saperdae]GGM43827.1 hypothetical protein GCM10010489_13760 [Microbacterium saperdae]
MTAWRASGYGKTAITAASFALIMTLASCTASTESGTGAGTETAKPAAASPTPVAPETPEPAETEPSQSATDGFREWLEASRLPDVETACARLTPELVTRMIAELEANGVTGIDSCEQMIATTAELYRSLDQSSDVDIAVQEETGTDATLFVTYLASGDCGTVVMTRPTTEWIITDQSTECAG